MNKTKAKTPTAKQLEFMGKVFYALAKEGTLHQRYGQLLLYIFSKVSGNNTFAETGVPSAIAEDAKMHYHTVRSGLKVLTELGAISVEKEDPMDSHQKILIHYDFDINAKG